MEKQEPKAICDLCQKEYDEDETRIIGDATVCNYCEEKAN